MPALSLASASALFLGLAIPAVVLAYRLRKPAKRVVVSTLFLFHDLLPKQSKRRRIQVPMRYLFEALALLLLVLAIANPTADTPGEHIVLLLDDSLSMQAHGNQKSTTRFQRAQERLRQFIAQQSVQTIYTLETTTTPTRNIPPLSSLEAQRAIDSAQPQSAADSIGSTVDGIRRRFPSQRLVIATDQKFQRSGKHDRITTLSVHEPVRNLWVSAIREEPAELTGNSRTIVGEIATTPGTTQTSVLVELHAAGTEKAAPALLSKEIRIEGRQASEVRFSLPIARHEKAAFEIRILPSEPDAISTDNSAYVVLGTVPDNVLLLVSDSMTDLGGLEKLRFVRTERKTTAVFQEAPSTELDRFQAVIFHRTVPNRLQKRPSLFILPPPGNTVFPTTTAVKNKDFTSWDTTHPLLLYLNISAYRLPSALVFEQIPWAQSVARVEEGPIILAGESGGVRLAAIGTELLPFEQAETPGPSILFLNTLKWLTGGEVLQEALLVGQTVDQTHETEIAGPLGSIEQGIDPETKQLLRPGIFVRTESGKRSLFAVNVAFPEESNTVAQREFGATDLVAAQEKNTDSVVPLWPFFVVAALFFACLDIGLAQFSKRQPGDRALLGWHVRSKSTTQVGN